MAKAGRAVFLIDLFKLRLVALTPGIFPYFRGNRLILPLVVKLAEYIPFQIRGRMHINALRISETLKRA